MRMTRRAHVDAKPYAKPFPERGTFGWGCVAPLRLPVAFAAISEALKPSKPLVFSHLAGNGAATRLQHEYLLCATAEEEVQAECLDFTNMWW